MVLIFPDFLIAGFGKCGSTTLCAMLAHHPAIYISTSKDSVHLLKSPCQKNIELYQEGYKNVRHETCIGEGNILFCADEYTSVLKHRLQTFYPETKLIFIVRDPIDRIESSYREFHHSADSYGMECPFNLDEALRKFPEILEISQYARKIRLFQELLPNNRLKIVFLEDIIKDSQSVLQQCFEYLEIDTSVKIDTRDIHLNKGSDKLYDTPQLRNMRNTETSPATGLPLSKLKQRVQDQFLQPLGYRVPFGNTAIQWSASAIELIRQNLASDSIEFLTSQQREVDIWPRFAALFKHNARTS